jgi:hypothetical protein
VVLPEEKNYYACLDFEEDVIIIIAVNITSTGGNEMNSEMQNAYSQYLRHKAYMAAYNLRDEVKEKRKAYNSKRWALMKEAAKLVKEEQL